MKSITGKPLTGKSLTGLRCGALLCCGLFAAGANAAPIITLDSGATAADIQASVDAFRASLGALNAPAPVSLAGGRRQIDWDAAPDAVSDPNPFPGNFFNANFAPRARGIEFNTTGSGFSLSSTAASGQPVEFGFDADLSFFSAERLFSPVGSNVTDVGFFLPSDTGQTAGANGLGIVFSNVITAGATTIELFDRNNSTLAFVEVPVSGPAGLSFAGVRFDADEQIIAARITTGTAQLLGNGSASAGNLVVMDDFIFAEPAAIPLPASLLLLAGGFGLLRWRRAAI